MKIALLGTRGIPASYGGFETCVEKIGQRLVKNGHSVYIYSKKSGYNNSIRSYLGMKIIKIPFPEFKGFGKLCYSIFSGIHSLFFNYDIHMVFGVSNSPVLLLYRLFNKKFALNTDGLEWKRGKWGFIGKTYYRVVEFISVLLCKNLITDSIALHRYYKSKFKADSTVITYGANIHEKNVKDNNKILKDLGLEPNKYILQITRFEPENNPLLTVLAYKKLHTDLKCVIIGGVDFPSPYSRSIYSEVRNSEEVILPGLIYEKSQLRTLRVNSFCYIHGNSVGGTNPSLLQAMAAGRPIIAYDCIFNKITLDGNAYFYNGNANSLYTQLTHIFNGGKKGEIYAQKALEQVKSKYSWTTVTKKYEVLFNKILNS
jgi:glycosyltransferase involved in cell wall biosynthesis